MGGYVEGWKSRVSSTKVLPMKVFSRVQGRGSPSSITVLTALALVSACRSKPPEPEALPKTENPSVGSANHAPAPVVATPPSEPKPSAEPTPAGSTAQPSADAAAATGTIVSTGAADPLGGKFTLQQATAGLKGKGTLLAEIETSNGKLECELYEDKAPITVANFVGLARGLRPFREASGNWVKRPAYDGTTFHRIIKGFMIQGGDPLGTGTGEPGYTIPDEIWEGARHDQRGLLCMANRGKDTNGMQFFIMDGAAPHLDGGYTIFGKCGPEDVVEAIASVPVVGERPENVPKITKVSLRRDATKKKQADSK